MTQYKIEIEIAEGLEAICQREVQDVIHTDTRVHKGALAFTHKGDLARLETLSTINAVNVVLDFPIPRPKALLGHQHFNLLVRTIRSIDSLRDAKTLYIDAAGSNSSVMQRIKAELASALNVVVSEDGGDIWLRMRHNKPHGWQVLIRTTQRPLATRRWRVCDMPGALNAPVARAMIHLATSLNHNQRTANIMSGSGTLMIEHCLEFPESIVFGCEIAADALECAEKNAVAADVASRIKQIQCDACNLPFLDDSLDTIYADLPFGQLVGSHEANQVLYPQVMAEAARVMRAGGKMVAITHQVRLMSQVLRQNSNWTIVSENRVSLRGLHPRMFLLERV
jgi:tRNA (guanine6-N2)-methyltransferase